ncbi:MAG: hypothetical protein IPK99_00385 [Flavobacteriales bacterium]|nr:hypothetical protein [Flavobacteriales bacterium]
MNTNWSKILLFSLLSFALGVIICCLCCRICWGGSCHRGGCGNEMACSQGGAACAHCAEGKGACCKGGHGGEGKASCCKGGHGHAEGDSEHGDKMEVKVEAQDSTKM